MPGSLEFVGTLQPPALRRDGFHPARPLPDPILPPLKTTEINTTTTAAIPASSLGSHPTSSQPCPPAVQLISLSNSPVPQQLACRIPLSSSLPAYPSCHPPHILSTTFDRQPASYSVSQLVTEAKHNMMPRQQTRRPAAAGFFHHAPANHPIDGRGAGGGCNHPSCLHLLGLLRDLFTAAR